MNVASQINPVGVVLIVTGLLAAIWSYRVARLQESLDAIGSNRSVFEVEPAGWMVTLTRVGGIITILVGIAVLFGFIF